MCDPSGFFNAHNVQKDKSGTFGCIRLTAVALISLFSGSNGIGRYQTTGPNFPRPSLCRVCLCSQPDLGFRRRGVEGAHGDKTRA